MVELYQHNNGTIHFEASYSEKKVVYSVLRYIFPDAEYSKAYRENKWDGIIRFYDKQKQTFPAGFKSLVISALKNSNIGYEIYREETKRIDNPVFKETMRPYQKSALLKLFKEKYGIIQVPTRGGKTFITAEAIRIISEHNKNNVTLFVVDSEDLFKQAIEDISKHLKINQSTIGLIKGTNFSLKNINVATIQTLTSIISMNNSKSKDVNKVKLRKDKRDALLKFIKTVNFIVIDECHMYSSDIRMSFIKRFLNTAEYRLMLSATPFKSEKPLDNLNLRTISGSIIYKIKESDLKNQGFLAEDIVLLIHMNHREDKNIVICDDDNYNEHLKKVITHNFRRNALITTIIEILRKYMIKTLVLFTRKEHGYYIKSMSGDPFITGDSALKERTFLRNSFLKKKGGVLLASDVFNKGITLPEVQILLNAGGGLEQSLVVQKKGRVLGTTKHKRKALIIDFIDDHDYFYEHSENRVQVYVESVGWDNINVLESTDKNFYEMFRSIIEKWFNVV